jgi:hypothetical protein
LGEERKEKKKKKTNKQLGAFFSGARGQACLAGCAKQDFCRCYVQLKASLRISL